MNREVYPPNWQELRDACIERAGYRCEQCGIPQGWLTFSKSGKPYLIYLSAAHRYPHQTYRPDAELMALCQACHRRYDRRFRRKPSRARIPLGSVVVWVCQPAGRVLAADASSLADLVEIVVALPYGTEFELQLVMVVQTVGRGRYRKEPDSLLVLSEEGAADGLCYLFESSL